MPAFPILVYVLCVATSLVCAVLLIRSYRRSRTTLLLWSALCFVGLALGNFFLFVDAVMFPDVDLLMVRHVLTLGAIMALLYGFVLESD